MSSQAREKSALINDVQIWVITLAVILLPNRLLFSFGSYVTLVAVVSMCSYDEI